MSLHRIWLVTGVLMLLSLATRRPPLVAVVVAAFLILSVMKLLMSDAIRKRGFMLGPEEFLCDTCKYDYGGVCNLPDRPNARRCAKYERGGT